MKKKKKKKGIIIQVKPEALVSCSETVYGLLLFFFQFQKKMHAHLAGLIWANHVLEYT